MICSDSHKFIFFQNPRTGTTSIDNILHKYGRDIQGIPFWREHFSIYRKQSKHIYPRSAKQYVGDLFDSYFKIVFVRNPFDRAVSIFKYHKSNCIIDNTDRYPVNSLREYLLLSRSIGMLRPQTEWVYDERQNQIVDYVGRFETIQESFDCVCDKLSIARCVLPTLNSTVHEHYSSYYDDETKDIALKIFDKDMKIFGYSF